MEGKWNPSRMICKYVSLFKQTFSSFHDVPCSLLGSLPTVSRYRRFSFRWMRRQVCICFKGRRFMIGYLGFSSPRAWLTYTNVQVLFSMVAWMQKSGGGVCNDRIWQICTREEWDLLQWVWTNYHAFLGEGGSMRKTSRRKFWPVSTLISRRFAGDIHGWGPFQEPIHAFLQYSLKRNLPY